MELTHSFTVPAGIDDTWKLLNDLEQVAPCFPGAELGTVEGDEFSGTVKVKLGPISMQYKGSGAFTQRDEAQYRAVIDAKGKDKRGNGTANATVVAQLSPHGQGTSIEVTTDLAITGKPAQFGRGVIQDVSDKLLDQFVECLSQRLSPEPVVQTGPEAAPAEPDAGATATASPGPAPQAETVASQPAGSQLDLGTTVVPLIVKRYAPQIIGAAVVILTLAWLRKKRRQQKQAQKALR